MQHVYTDQQFMLSESNAVQFAGDVDCLLAMSTSSVSQPLASLYSHCAVLSPNWDPKLCRDTPANSPASQTKTTALVSCLRRAVARGS